MKKVDLIFKSDGDYVRCAKFKIILKYTPLRDFKSGRFKIKKKKKNMSGSLWPKYRINTKRERNDRVSRVESAAGNANLHIRARNSSARRAKIDDSLPVVRPPGIPFSHPLSLSLSPLFLQPHRRGLYTLTSPFYRVCKLG